MSKRWLNILDGNIFAICIFSLLDMTNRIPDTPFISERIFEYSINIGLTIYCILYIIGLLRYRDPGNKIGCILRFWFYFSILGAVALILNFFL